MRIRSYGGPRSRFGRMRYAMRASSAIELLAGADTSAGGGGGDTSAGGGGGEQSQDQGGGGTPTPTPAPSGDPWYSTGLTADEDKTWLANKGYGDLASTIAAHRSLEQKLGAGRFNVPSDWNDPAQATAAYKALGLPDAPGDAYKLELPADADATFATSFAEKAHAAGVLPHQFKALGAAYMAAEADAAQAAQAAARTAAQADITALKAGDAWGGDFEKNDAIAGAAAKAFNLDVTKLAKAMGTKGALSFLLDLGKKTGEAGMEGGNAGGLGGMSGVQAGEAKKTFMADPDKVAKLRAKDPATVQEWQNISAAMAAELDRAEKA